MTKLTALLVALVFLTLTGCAETTKPEKKTDTSETLIGTYDSRAIAVAFIGSEVYKATAGKKMADMMVEYNKAKAEGDKQRMEELEKWGKAQQATLHKQGFSTASVDDMLRHIKDQIPEIVKTTGVSHIVSKWDKETLAKYKSAELVDITMELVNVFHPTERQLKTCIEIQEHDPISLEKAGAIDD